MPLLRLLLAFALTIAIPLQGLASASCICKLRQAQDSMASRAMASQAVAALRHPATAASFMRGAASQAASASNKAGPATMHVGVPASPPKHHGACPKCSMSCCQVALSPPGAGAIEVANGHALEAELLPARFASWAEPVPHKPPRS